MIKTRPGEPLGTHFITLPWVRMALGISSISFIFVGSAQAAQALVDRAPPHGDSAGTPPFLTQWAGAGSDLQGGASPHLTRSTNTNGNLPASPGGRYKVSPSSRMRKEAQRAVPSPILLSSSDRAQTVLTHMDMASQHHPPSPAWLTQKKLVDEACPWNKIPSQFPRHACRQQPPPPSPGLRFLEPQAQGHGSLRSAFVLWAGQRVQRERA